MSGSISQITIRWMLGYCVNVPAVTPAPQPTMSTDFGLLCNSAGRWPSIRCRRMSAGSVEASIFPLTWKFNEPSADCETATEEFSPSPTYLNSGSGRFFNRLRP